MKQLERPDISRDDLNLILRGNAVRVCNRGDSERAHEDIRVGRLGLPSAMLSGQAYQVLRTNSPLPILETARKFGSVFSAWGSFHATPRRPGLAVPTSAIGKIGQPECP